jgi:phage tail-like protein
MAGLEDPTTNSRFYVEVEGLTAAVFTEVTGLQAEVEVQDYAEGGLNETTHRFPGRRKFSNVTLKRGLTSSKDFWQWVETLYSDNAKRCNVSIVLYSTEGEPLHRWNCRQAFPTKWVGPQFTAATSAIAIESLEFAHEGFELAQ